MSAVGGHAPVVRAAAYLRISKDRDGKGLGVERQLEDCLKVAAANGWTVDPVNVYQDNDTSAYTGAVRPRYRAMLAAMEQGKIDAVVAYHPSRLHRRTRELESYIDVCDRRNIRNATATAGEWDLSTPSGAMIAKIFGSVDQADSATKGERIARSRRQAAEKGIPPKGPRAYGYTSGSMEVVAEEAAVIVAAARAVLEGQTLRGVARDMNNGGVRTAHGKLWTSQQLKTMLTSPRIAALSEYKGEIVGKGIWPAIVSEQTHQALVRHLGRSPRSKAGGGPAPKYVGTGLYRCGVCGEKTLRVSGGGRRGQPSYRCRNAEIAGDSGTGHVSRTVASLDLYVETAVVQRLKQAGLIQKLVSVEDPEAAETLRGERRDIEAEMRELGVLAGQRQTSVAAFAAALAGLEDRIVEIDAELARLGDRSPLAGFENVDIEALWPTLPVDQRRAVIDFLAEVTVLKMKRTTRFDPDGVRIVWKVGGMPPDSVLDG